MKKSLLLIVCFILLMLSGCNSKPKEFTLRYEYEDGTLYQEFIINEGKDIELASITKVGYTFDGWYLNNQKVTKIDNLSEDVTVVAKFYVNEYTYKFIVNDEVIKEEKAPYGSTIEYPSNPELSETFEATYEFIGWDNNHKKLYQDEVFNALFDENDKYYTYQFLDENGNIIKKETATYGSEIIYPNDLEKEDTIEFDFIFKGWNKTDQLLTSDITFTPVFESKKQQYTCKFVDDNGDVISESKVDYGTMPNIPSDVFKETVNGKEYKFVGWDKEVEIVTGDVVYTAVFEEKQASLDGLKLSIFGDSISTFYSPNSDVNSYYTGELQYYYPDRCPSISTVDLTWWYKLYHNNNMTLGVNNSWSGSAAYGVNNVSAGMHDARLNTVDENGMPDLVIIYMGTNDLLKGYSTDEFSTAIQTMITKLKAKGVKDIFLFTLGYTDYTGYSYTEEGRTSYNNELRRLAEINQCGIIPLDEYIINDNYMIYLSDTLHYNAKGANLISLVAEKALKEYYNIPFDKEIEVEHKELIPDGYIGMVTATAKGEFFNKYTTDVFFAEVNDCVNPVYADRYQISKNEDGTYYVSAISKSGESLSYDCDYVLYISVSHVNYKDLKYNLSKVTVGCLVEFNFNNEYPIEILFKEATN